MIKKLLFILSFFCVPQALSAENILNLPAPETKGGIPLMEAINARKTTREFSAKKIDNTDLSNILYVAWGFSHDEKRTIPTAKNEQDMRVYAVLSSGVWRYDAKNNTLIKVSDIDLKPFIALQEFVKEAPLTLLYAGHDEKNAAMNAAAAYQNVGLYCASRGLNNTVRGYIEKEKIAEALHLIDEKIIISQTIGWPYM